MDMKLYKLFFNQAVTLKSELGWNEEIPNSTVKNIDLIEILCNSKQLKQHWFYIMWEANSKTETHFDVLARQRFSFCSGLKV